MDMSADDSNAFSALLSSAVGVDDPRDMRNNALSAGWMTSPVGIMELFRHAMTSSDVHALGTEYYDDEGDFVEAEEVNGTMRVRRYAERAQAIRNAAIASEAVPKIPDTDTDDSLSAVRKGICDLMAEAGLRAPPVDETAPVAAPIAGTASGPQDEKKPTKFTEGLHVKPSDVHDKLFKPKKAQFNQDSSEEDHASSDDEEAEAADDEKVNEPAYPHYKDPTGRMQATKVAPELMMSLPAVQGRGSSVLNTLEAVDIMPLSAKSQKHALRQFSMVKGLPLRKKEDKEYPLLDIMTKAGVPGMDTIQSALVKANKDVHQQMTQDVNSIYIPCFEPLFEDGGGTQQRRENF
jgi:hypothetical protein